MRSVGKNYWALFLMILAGIVLGGFVGTLTEGVSGLGWLNYGHTFGISTPIIVDLGILVLSFGLTIRITVSSIIGIIAAALIYRFL